MNEDVISRKKITVVFIIISILMILGTIAIFSMTKKDNSNTEPANDTSTVSVDPISGEEIITSPDKDKEVAGVNPNKPSFLGFQTLVNNGATYDDIITIKDMISEYILTLNLKSAPIVSLKPSTWSQQVTGTGDSVYSFDFYINSQNPHTCNIKSDQISALSLTISKDSQVVYTKSR